MLPFKGFKGQQQVSIKQLSSANVAPHEVVSSLGYAEKRWTDCSFYLIGERLAAPSPFWKSTYAKNCNNCTAPPLFANMQLITYPLEGCGGDIRGYLERQFDRVAFNTSDLGRLVLIFMPEI